MKKSLVILLAILFLGNCVLAKDYAKLHMKEMKHAQKYSTTKKYFEEADTKTGKSAKKVSSVEIKDPKLLVFGNQEEINPEKYNKKILQDDEKYEKMAKSLKIKSSYDYSVKSKGEDFYKIYRVAERIIRANNLDYINWRIGIYKDAQSPNAYSANTNYIAISTSMYDTFLNNDDALAFVIGHEMAHSLLGHHERTSKIIQSMEKTRELAKSAKSSILTAEYYAKKRKYLIDAKNMEYAADVEGAKLVSKAGYNLDKASEVISFLNTLPTPLYEYSSDHPDAKNRLQNFSDNRKYFIEDEWKNIGKNNIYNSEVLPVKLSSDKTSIVISCPEDKLNPKEYYSPETMEELNLRFAYKYYLNGEFDKSIKYFKDYFKLNNKNAAAYLYASYAYEQLYKLKGSEKNLEEAKQYAKIAYNLEQDNKYIKEQTKALKSEKL